MNGLRHIKTILSAVLILLMILTVSGGADYAFADNGLEIEIKSAYLGNIFVGKSFDFDITVKNSSNAAVNGTLKYTVTCGSAVKSGEKSVLASSGNTAVKIADSLDKYGIYTINISFTSSGEVKAAAESEFSLICKAEQNPNVGFAQHALALGIGTADNAAYFSKLFGCGITRDDYPMCFVENYDGSVRTAPDNSTRRITNFTQTALSRLRFSDRDPTSFRPKPMRA